MISTAATAAHQASELLVAGVGASAGGLEAMLLMFSRMSPTGRIAYVVAQHMAHNAHSELVVRLIQRESALPVVLAQTSTRLAADNVYVIPASMDGVVRGDTLSLHKPVEGQLSTPSINTLLTSIAASLGKRAIAIVLSGAGSDGLTGCRAIRNCGGLTLAQDPAEAKHNGIPSGVINAGLTDRVLSAADIGEALAVLYPGVPSMVRISSPAKSVGVTCVTPPLESEESIISKQERIELEQLLRQVRDATGIDFSSYKEETLLRRLQKRKSTLGINSAEGYQALIRREPEELHVLQHLFLVSMSSFFRDRASFSALERVLLGHLNNKMDGEPIRAWVAGCASGEEPYTLAIILRELLGGDTSRHPIEITATDLNPEALAMAAEGIYRKTLFREMESRLLEQYFTPRGNDYEVKPQLRDNIRFEQRDILAAAAQQNLDLVSCRNLLIYLKSRLQDRLIKSFHEALIPQGILFIGQSESLSFIGNSLFCAIDQYHRLFRRRR